LRGGVTTLRDLGDRGFVTLALRDDPLLPTILAAGPPITQENGHCWYLGGACSGEADLRRAVAERADRRCDVVKVMATGGFLTPGFPMWDAQFTTDELRSIVEESHRAGLPVAAHCHGIVGIERALDAGADTIEHCTFFSSNGRPEPSEALMARLASTGVVISATLGRLPGHPVPPEVAAHQGTLLEARRRLHELGANVVVGSDAGINPAKPHDVLPYAFGDLVASGMSPIEGLRSLTMMAARACGVAERKGRVAAGFDADIIAVAGDPLGEPSVLASVSAVWRAGNQVR
jgi:imidazolonepropionase-like amidohydrolase